MEEKDFKALEERLSDTIKETLKKNDPWHRHPAVLMIFGFLLTSVLGAGLTYYVDKLEFEREQELKFSEKLLENKLSLMNSTSELTGNFLTAVYKVHGYYNVHYSSDSLGEQFESIKREYDEANKALIIGRDRIHTLSELYTMNEKTIELTFDSINQLTHLDKPNSINIYVQALFRNDLNRLAQMEEDSSLKEFRIVIKRKADRLNDLNNRLHAAFLHSMNTRGGNKHKGFWQRVFGCE